MFFLLLNLCFLHHVIVYGQELNLEEKYLPKITPQHIKPEDLKNGNFYYVFNSSRLELTPISLLI